MNDADILAFVKPYTSASDERILNVLELVERAVRENVPGDFAEVGVCKGGLIMAMALKCKQLGVSRTIHAYDTFEAPADKGELVDFISNINKVDYLDIVVHVCDIAKIDPKYFPEFALLRLGTDSYEYALAHMEPRVSLYGVVIVGDWKGSRLPTMNAIDYSGVWWQKDYGRSKLDGNTSETATVLRENFHHFVGLYDAVGRSFHRGCGSYMIDGQKYAYTTDSFKKQEQLFYAGQKAKNVLEVGVYLGHSLLILLLSNPELRITCIDNDPQFSPAAVRYLNAHFGNRVTFHLGTAEEVLARETLGTFDCIHIDADHNESAVARQFRLTQSFATPDALYVFDDYEAVRGLIDSWIANKELIHVHTPWCLWTNIITRLNKVSS